MIESGEKFGKYTLLERLAAGGMAEIYRASVPGRDGSDKVVAIKRLHQQFSEDEDFATMLIDEAKLAVQLRHPNIGQVFDLERIDGQYFIVMEYIDGLDLQELAAEVRERGHRFPLEALVYVGARAAEALHYAHTRHGSDGAPLEVVHRDVSPQNIMIDVDGRVKLVDFGIAKARMRAQHTRAGVIKGKFYYMSPEQAHGNKLDARSDVYGLGMVLYEVLTGGHPFEDVPDNELLNAVRAADYPPIGSVLPRLARPMVSIVDRALERSVERRFESARQLQKALESYGRQSLAPFGAQEMAKFLERYHRPQRDAFHGADRMEPAAFTTGKHSVIFDADIDEFEEGGKTEIFVRDRPSQEPEFDDLESGGATEMLDWAPKDSDEKAGAAGEMGTPQAQEQRSSMPTPAGREESPTYGAPHSSVESNRSTDEWRELDDGIGPAPKGDFGGGQDSEDASGIGEKRKTTAQITRRLVTTLYKRFDKAFRTHPEAIGAGAAALAVLVLGVSAWVAWGPSASQEEDSGEWHAGVAEASDAAIEDDEQLELPLSTQPAGASVYVDDELAGTTPLSVGPLVLGESYRLRIERQGYEARDLNFVAESGMAPRVVRLEPLGGIIRVESEPEGAEIYVNDEAQGQAPVTVMGLARDAVHDVEARFSDDEERAQVQWEEGDERVQEVAFEFDVEEPQAAAPRRQPSPSPRSSTGGASARSSSSPPPAVGESSDRGGGGALDIFGDSEEEERGRLNVRTNADEGRIYVDGQMVKDGTVLIGHPLAPGRYEVRAYFSSSGQYSATETVQIYSGETSTVILSQ